MALPGLLFAGLVSFLFGLLVIIFPRFLRYAVGFYLLFTGIYLVIVALL